MPAQFIPGLPRISPFLAGCLLCSHVLAADSAAVPCLDGAKPLLDQRIEIADEPRRISLPAAPGADLLVQAAEDGIDVEILLEGGGSVPAVSADSPVPRQGVQRMVVTSPARPVSVVLRSVDQLNHRGAVRLVVSVLPGKGTGCLAIARDLARADRLFAAAQQFVRGESPAGSPDSDNSAAAAEQVYRQVAIAIQEKGLEPVRGEVQLAVAAVDYYILSRWSESARWAGEAYANLQSRPYLRARARSLQAAAWLDKPDTPDTFQRARAIFAELASYHHARGESYEEALQVNFIGVAYFNEAQFDLAIPRYQAAQALFAQLGETQRSALALQNLALCEWGLGRISHGLVLFDQALAALDPVRSAKKYVLTLENAANAYQAAGNFDKSLSLLDDALRRATRMGDKFYRARSLFGIGVTYYGIGNRALARQFLLDAITIWTPELDPRGRLSALRALAVIENEDGNFALADRYNVEALQLARSAIARDRISLKMADTAMARGDLDAAAKIIEPLAADPTPIDRLMQAEAWTDRAKLRLRRGDLRGAEGDLRRALPVLKESESVGAEFGARVELARLLKTSGQNEEAQREVTKALSRSEELRAQTANPEYGASVASLIRPALDLRLDLLWESRERLIHAGDTAAATRVSAEALAVSDASRGRAFEQYRRQTLDARDPQMAQWLAQRTQLLRDLSDRQFFLATRADHGADDARAKAIREDIRRLRVSLGVVDASIAGRTKTDPAAPTSVDALIRKFARHDGPVGIEYWIGGQSSYAWLIEDSRVSWIRIGDGPAIIAAARRFHDSLANFATVPRRDRQAAAQQLSDLIVAPIYPELRDTHRWLISPDGPLHFIPFAALSEPGQPQNFLVQRVSIAMTPALRHAPDAGRENIGPLAGRILLVSDPIYQASDPRLSPAGSRVAQGETPVPQTLRAGTGPESWVRLPATAREADGIRALFAAANVDELKGADATRDAFLRRDLSRYRYLHLATHGVMDAEIPAMSALVLGAFDGKGSVADPEIRAGDLLGTRLDADLVVLSACNTSLGPSFPDEGPMGLRYMVLARGARAVISSLWVTADEINADLMTDTYGRMLGEGEPVELALATAMQKLLGRKPAPDPALWAPYSVYVVGD